MLPPRLALVVVSLLSACVSRPIDAGFPDDSGPLDSGPLDSGPPDSGPPDSGPPDSGSPDSGTPPATPVWMCANGEIMGFDPLPVGASAPLILSISGEVERVEVGLSFTGPGTATVDAQSVSDGGPFVWTYAVSGLSEGRWFATFTADSGATAVCTASVPVHGDTRGAQAGARR
ncbi:MAG: hypothetical protein EXR69_00430 [Myxococcales bacterium]|nr:hypothetical protein [Myxococcales bacterium]